MTTKPEALRLADRLESDFIRSQTMVDAAAELRRLHELLEAEQTLHQRVIYPELQRLRTQRGELLRALERLLQSADVRDAADAGALKQARAAIKAVEGETK